MSKQAKKQKVVVEQVLNELFGKVTVEWSNSAHPVGTFMVKGKKFTYSVDSSPKTDYTVAKTKKMVVNSLRAKAVQWGYITDPSQFEAAFVAA